MLERFLPHNFQCGKNLASSQTPVATAAEAAAVATDVCALQHTTVMRCRLECDRRWESKVSVCSQSQAGFLITPTVNGRCSRKCDRGLAETGVRDCRTIKAVSHALINVLWWRATRTHTRTRTHTHTVQRVRTEQASRDTHKNRPRILHCGPSTAVRLISAVQFFGDAINTK